MPHDNGDFVGRTSEQYNGEDAISFEVEQQLYNHHQCQGSNNGKQLSS